MTPEPAPQIIPEPPSQTTPPPTSTGLPDNGHALEQYMQYGRKHIDPPHPTFGMSGLARRRNSRSCG